MGNSVALPRKGCNSCEKQQAMLRKAESWQLVKHAKSYISRRPTPGLKDGNFDSNTRTHVGLMDVVQIEAKIVSL